MSKVKTIAFDADDTLWINEPIFTNTRVKFEELLGHYIDVDSIEDQLYQVERRNLALFGYGIKGFVLSMIETSIELTNGQILGKDIDQIINLGKEMLIHPVQLLPDVEEVILKMKEDYEIMIITKGDLFDQENKIARSRIAQHFKWIEIVSEKDEASYHEVINKYNIDIETFMMIGNSLKSDVLPICNLGGQAIHIPFHDTWQHEVIPELTDHPEYLLAESISEIPRLLAKN